MRHNALYVVVVALALIVIDGPDFAEGQRPSLTITSPVDVTSGENVCQNTQVEFTCVGVNVASLQWQENGNEVDTINSLSDLGRVQRENFLVYRDEITNNDVVGYNITTRLVFNLSDVPNGDRITCRSSVNSESTMTLNYGIRSAPSALESTDYKVTMLSQNIFKIVWNSTFTSLHDVTSYRAVITGNSTATCPSTCLPTELCQCTAPAVGEPISINISAANCGDQEGPAVALQAQARRPSQPLGCSGVPVYNYTSDLIRINLQWMRVDDPSEFTMGVRQDVTQYSIVVGDATLSIPSTTACSTVNCSYLIPPSLSTPSFRASVAAMNVFGAGLRCSVEMPIEFQNQQFLLIISTTNPAAQTVECLPSSPGLEGFACEFCYNPVSSCLNGPRTCEGIDGQLTFDPSLSELTYCYRATARINGTSVAVVQGNFSTACLAQSLVTDQIMDPSLSNGSLTIPGGLVVYNGTVEGAVATYKCNSGYTLSGNAERVCRSDGNWNGVTPRCTPSGLTIGNIILLVLSIVFWVLSVILTVVETVIFVLVSLKKCKSLSLPRRWHKLLCIILLTGAVALLVTTFILWIVFATAVGNPSSLATRNSSVIVAFIFSILALIVTSSVVVFILVMKNCKDPASVKPTNDDYQPQDPGTIKKDPIALGEELYAQPNGQRTSTVEDNEHRDGPGNAPKKKNMKVKKKDKQKKNKNQETKTEYDTLMGEGRHIGTLTGADDAPLATPERGQYGKLEGREHYTEPFDTLKGHYEMSEYPSVSENKNKNQGPEYAVVDKKSKRKK